MNRSRITGDLTASGLLYADIANDRVGIGSTIPGNKVSLPDSAKIGLGNAEDLWLEHNGSNSKINNTTGTFYIQGDTISLAGNNGSHNLAKFIKTGACELYHNNAKVLHTSSNTLYLTGNASESNIICKTSDGTTRGIVGVTNSNSITLYSGSSTKALEYASNALTLYHTGNAKLATTSSGVTVTGTCTATTFSGSGASLTSLPAAQLSGTAAAINGSNITNVNATTLDSIDSASFLRSDADDTATGRLALTNSNIYPFDINGSDDGKIVLQGSSNPYIRFREGSTDKAYIQWSSSGYFQLRNAEDGSGIQIKDDIRFTTDNFSSTDYKIWHAGNDGTGSGLDADTLDGVQGASFVRSDADDTMSGQLTLTSSTTYALNINSSDNGKINLKGSSSPYIRFKEGTTDKAYIEWSSSGYFQLRNQEDGSGIRVQDDLRFTTDNFSSTNHKIWHAGNDGASSGLDADTLDGVEGASYLRSDANDSTSGALSIQGHQFVNHNTYNLIIRCANGSSAGICQEDSSSNFMYQLYGSGGNHYGFLDSKWGQWDIKKAFGGQLQVDVSGSLYTVWHTGNDGAGSGLDADTVDGYATSQSGGANNIAVYASNGYLSVNNWIYVANATGLYAPGGSHFYNGGASTWKSWINQSTHTTACGIGMRTSQGTDRGWTYADSSHVGFLNAGGSWLLRAPIGNQNAPETGGGYGLWHTGNDGAGSGLDADTLDGVQLDSIVRHNNNTNYILKFGSGTNTGHTRTSLAYAIFQEGGAWSNPYPDLCINYHTGIKIGCGSAGYGGLRFTPDYNDNTVLMGINDSVTGGGGGGSNVFITNKLLIGGKYDNNPYSAVASTRLLFGGGNDQSNYHIGTNMEDYGGNYTKFDIRWHTGIRMGAQQGYGGIRFFSNEDLDDLKFSIMGGGNHVKCYTNFLPGNSTSDIGDSSNRWRNIYTSDLSLSNETIEGGNDVDGTWGDWTLQEGEEDIYMINNRTGKKYAMMLREVS